MDITQDSNIDELERIANDANDGKPWRVYRCRWCDEDSACGIKDTPFASAEDDCIRSGVVYCTNRDECQHPMALVDAEFIAAFSPSVVLALISRIRELEDS